MTDTAEPAYLGALRRHFADLRDGRHGGVAGRRDKEALFADTVRLLDPVARQALAEVNEVLLLGSGTVAASGLVSRPGTGPLAQWSLGWPEQQRAGIQPVLIQAHFGTGFHHPHLRGGTVSDWPLNVFSPAQAAAELPTLRAIIAADLHNLVFQADYRIIPAVHNAPAS
jgi:hypothetical protein